ncbi:class I SAM-dependent methyltransferase [Pyrococcus kukulkanii]|uniref:class I SAM-dependent methyltransferase n=1 Tax=Pyrococcus kukulkanii TaxID=1609559 RepID=UPI0035691821
MRLAEEIVKRSEGRILNVGSGSGFLALELSRKGEVVGIEREEGLFEFLKSFENDRLRFLNIDFLKDDIEGKFDTIVFSYILHDFEPRPLLEKALKLLEQDGKIIIGDFDVNNLKNKNQGICKRKQTGDHG